MNNIKKSVTIFLIIALICSLSACNKNKSKPTMNLCDYFELTYEGTNGEGRISIEGQRDMKKDFMQKKGGNVTDMQLQTLVSGVNYSVDKKAGLSNGDNIVLTINVDDDIKDSLGVKLIGGTKEFIVSGLPEKVYEEFDPFGENFYISFEGTSPFITVKEMGESVYNHIGGKYEIQNFDIESQCLKNGDIIKIKFIYDEKLAESNCIRVASTEKEIEINGYNAYVQSIDELSDTQIAKLVSDAREKIWILGYGNYKEAKYCGNYFYTAKDKEAHGVSFLSWCGTPVGNAICFIFEHPQKIGVSDSPNVYTVIALENLLVNTKGELVYNRHDMTPMNNCYESKDLLQKAFVGVFDEIMNCAENVNFE